jgi:hypothetical protein
VPILTRSLHVGIVGQDASASFIRRMWVTGKGPQAQMELLWTTGDTWLCDSVSGTMNKEAHEHAQREDDKKYTYIGS